MWARSCLRCAPSCGRARYCGQHGGMQLAEFQDLMARTYGKRDRARGVARSIAWLVEEVGELSQAVRKGDDSRRLHEIGDVLAWLASITEQLGLSLEDAAARYAAGCPTCASIPCTCR